MDFEKLHSQISEFSENAKKAVVEARQAVETAETASKVAYKAVLDNQVYNRSFKESLDRIEGQTTMHNGRMGKIERMQSFIQGGLAIVAIILVPVILFIAYQVLTPKAVASQNEVKVVK